MTAKKNKVTESKNSKNKKINTSILIAIIALMVSSISAMVGIRETQIMSNQQKIFAEQKEASVWPYIEHSAANNYIDENEATYEYTVTNKGVGPAIIDSVIYVFKGEEISGWELPDELQIKYPDFTITDLSNTMLDKKVLAPGEILSVVKLSISKKEDDKTELWTILNRMNFHLEYCYCSIYGKCWKVSNSFTTTVSDECQINENIR